jgi:CubicO group peptidase (beta-lactamase class C family)
MNTLTVITISALVLDPLVSRAQPTPPLPASGPIVPQLSEIETIMRKAMAIHELSAGTVAIMKDSKLILREGYGWADADHTMVIHPDNLFRIASVSKVLTHSAIIKLIKEKKISENTRIYSYLGIHPWGGCLGDNRIANITVKNLVDHSGGWLDEGSACVFQTLRISKEMGLNHPATARDVISWQFSKPLEFTPGTTNKYSNFGYQILGRVIEKASGKRYIDYIQQDLLGIDVVRNPIGFNDIVLSRSRPQDRAAWEIWYTLKDDQRQDDYSAVDYPLTVKVHSCEAYYMESFDSFGGLSASAVGLCKYMLHYWVGGPERSLDQNWGWGYGFGGALPGAASGINQEIQQHDGKVSGLEVVVLFNGGKEVKHNVDGENAMTGILSLAKKFAWPSPSGGAIEWSVAETNVMAGEGRVTVQLVRAKPDTSSANVSYTTYSRTAVIQSYVPQSGVVSFARGETKKDVTINLRSGRKIPKSFLLELISASDGGWIGDRRTCIVRISDLQAHSAAQKAADDELLESKRLALQAKAVQYNQDLADKGDAWGQFRMGERYRDGDGVPKDKAKAKEFFAKSAAQGNKDASRSLEKLNAGTP